MGRLGLDCDRICRCPLRLLGRPADRNDALDHYDHRDTDSYLFSGLYGGRAVLLAFLLLSQPLHHHDADPSLGRQLLDHVRQVLSSLTPKEEKIIRLRFGLSEPNDSASDEFKITDEEKAIAIRHAKGGNHVFTS